MQILRKYASICAIGTMLLTGSANAAGIPVIDSSNLAQTIAQLQQSLKDYEQQLQQVAALKTQIENQIKQITAMTGGKGISGILNTDTIKDLRLSATSLDGIMSSVISGGDIAGQGSAIKAKIDELKDKFDFSDLAKFDGSANARDKATAQLAGSGLAAVGTATDGFEKADAAAKRVTSLIDGIDNTADLKASVDYNTRVQAEVASLLVEVIRLQAANANALGMAQAVQARDTMAGRKFGKVGEKEITK